MHATAIKKMEIIHKIAKLPEHEISELDKYIQNLFLQLKFDEPKPVSLKGIWKDTKLSTIADLDSEINSVRRELSDSILQKSI